MRDAAASAGGAPPSSVNSLFIICMGSGRDGRQGESYCRVLAGMVTEVRRLERNLPGVEAGNGALYISGTGRGITSAVMSPGSYLRGVVLSGTSIAFPMPRV